MAPTEAIAGAFRRIAACIQSAETAMIAKSSMKQLCQRPAVSLSQPSAVPWLSAGKKGREVGHADREGAAREAHAERGDQGLCVSVRVGQQEGRQRCPEHGQRVDEPAAVARCADAKQDADERAREDRHADHEAELRLAEAEILFDLDANDGEDRPDREAGGEGDSREP